MAYVPQRGDIVHLAFDPATGCEMQGPHFGLVISGRLFNAQGLAWVCPISQGAAALSRTYGTVVTLMGLGLQTQGAVYCHQLKALDWRQRKARFQEACPQALMDEVSARLEAILFE